MQMATAEATTRFPVITFRKKRLSIAIHAHFDMGGAEEVASVKRKIEETINQLLNDGHAKVSYSVVDL